MSPVQFAATVVALPGTGGWLAAVTVRSPAALGGTTNVFSPATGSLTPGAVGYAMKMSYVSGSVSVTAS